MALAIEKKCRINIQTVSGNVGLHTSADSLYTAHYHTLSGDFDGPESPAHKARDEDEDAISRQDRTVRIGGGGGAVHGSTVSGDLSIGSP